MQPGDSLAHYEIRAPLGKGGMGEVFLATDTKLNRDVALKILPEDFARDTERVARFRREAQVLASLNHPNIAAIYGLEEDQGHLILVMELAPGQDLSRILENGPLPLDEALRIARAVAEGMAEAHDKGIVHRDLKPANVAVEADGPVKVLDFGLARAFAGDDGMSGDPASISHSPTITAAMTQQGVILGTAAYMSPEQARGKTAGKQADIWAFGCLLFEMLTARRLFDGPTVSDSVAAILKNDPPWHKLPAETPASIRRLLRRCLEKETQRRLRDIGDACLEIDEAGNSPDETSMGVSPTANRGRGALLWPVVTGILAVTVAILGWQGSRNKNNQLVSPPPRIADLVQMTDQPGVQINPSLSPDGKILAYASWDNGDSDIFVQRVGGSNPVNLTAGYDGADSGPAFSPDGEKIAFRSAREGGGIFVMGATGEAPLRVAEGGFDPCWSPDGTSLAYSSEIVDNAYGRDGLANLSIVDLTTGQARLLHEIDAVDPDWSPSGQRLVFWSHLTTIQGQRDIYTIDVAGTEPVAVTLDSATDWSPRWSSDGRWIYFISDRGGNPDLWRIGIDEKTGLTTGAPEAVTAGMAIIAEVSISRSGSLALTSRSESGEIYTQAFDPVQEIFLGQRQTLLSSSHAFSQISMTRDGSKITYRTTAPTEHIYIMAGDGSDRRRLVADEHRNRGPEISPDGNWIVFYSNRSGNYLLWAIRIDGTGLRQVTAPPAEINDPIWTPDGRIMALGQFPEATLVEVHLPAGGLEALRAPAAVSRLENTSDQYLAAISPDGRYRAFVDMSSQSRAYVQDVRSGQRLAVAVAGRPVADPGEIHWMDNERIILWENANKRAIIWNVTTRAGKTIPDITEPSTMLFTADGKRAIVNRVDQKSDIWLLSLAR